MHVDLKLIYVFDDNLYPDDFPRIVSHQIAISRLSTLSERELILLFYGFSGRDKIMLNAGVSHKGTGSNLRGKVFGALERGEIVAVETFPGQLATIGPFYADEKGYLQPYQQQGPGYPIDRIIRRYEQMVENYGYRARPTIFPAQRQQQPSIVQDVSTTASGAANQKSEIPENLTKAQRWQQRKYLIGRGERSVYPDAQIAAKRLAENNIAVEKAKLAQNVYGDGKITNALAPMKNVPEGWTDISNNEEMVHKLGLNSAMLYDKQEMPDFFARIYQPDAGVFGKDMNPTLVFRGSRAPELNDGLANTAKKIILEKDTSGIKNINDWTNNFNQAVGVDSEYYKKSVEIGTAIKYSSPIDISGHSLGGGMASAASLASGKHAWTFNSSGLNMGTVTKYGGQLVGSSENIQAYRVNGELLTKIQEVNFPEDIQDTKGIIPALILKEEITIHTPSAIGNIHTLSGGTGSTLDKHGIDQVIKCIEDQKEYDTSTIRSRM